MYHNGHGILLTPAIERRRSERFTISRLCFADVAGVRARLVDVSESGLGLEHDAEIEVGTLLDVVIADRLDLTLRAAVIHSEFRRRAPGLGVFRSGAQLVSGVLLDCDLLAQ
jgi:hypothetical protein